MATTSLTSSLRGLFTCSNLCVYCEHSCHGRRKPRSSPRVLRLPLSPLQHQYGWHTASFIHRSRFWFLGAIEGDDEGPEDYDEEQPPPGGNSDELAGDLFRKKLENIIGNDDDAKFSGKDLAMLIRNKYGRSYDVQLIKKEFMGRQLLAMNVMWKYREQRSFPLTEEEYLLRLDDVANNLKCWGAVSYVRNSLAKTKERPRIGKAVSIFIDLDESGGRAGEWIYR